MIHKWLIIYKIAKKDAEKTGILIALSTDIQPLTNHAQKLKTPLLSFRATTLSVIPSDNTPCHSERSEGIYRPAHPNMKMRSKGNTTTLVGGVFLLPVGEICSPEIWQKNKPIIINNTMEKYRENYLAPDVAVIGLQAKARILTGSDNALGDQEDYANGGDGFVW